MEEIEHMEPIEEAPIESDGEATRCTMCQMTIDEAIQHCRDVASKTEQCRCADEHLRLAEWLEELKSLKSKHTYLAADFDNYKKRVQRDKAEALASASREIALDIFPVVSTFEVALKAMQGHSSECAGFKLVLDCLVNALSKHGFQKIGVKVGDMFDVKTCEALSSEECSLPCGTVSDVYSDGWMQNGKVIQPAKVVVAM